MATVAIVAIALFVEFRPDVTVHHPFLTEDVPAGAQIGEWNTEQMDVPAGLFDPVTLPATARVPLAARDPVLAGAVGAGNDLPPEGWWVIETELPDGTPAGARARLLIGDQGEWIEAIVVSPAGDDDFGDSIGTVAVSPEVASRVAAALSAGTLIVMIETG